MNPSPVENRKVIREKFRVPAILEIEHASGNAALKKVLLGFTSDINRSGLGVKLASAKDLHLHVNGDITINIDINRHSAHKLTAKLVWIADDFCGLKFHNESLVDKLLTQIGEQSALVSLKNPKIEKHYLYINGKDVDTPKHEFFPYADKLILENKTTRQCIHQIKTGRSPENAEDYIFAQYAVANTQLNNAAIYAAHSAFQEFKSFSLQRRRKIIDDIRNLLIKDKEALMRIMIIEGHPRKVAEWEYSGMVTGCSPKSLDFFVSELQKVVLQTEKETMINVRRPEGVVCVVPPGNASASNSLTAILALLAGNTLIVKPPLASPISTIYLWRNIVGKALKMNGAPDGTINILVGNSKKLMEEWLENPYVKCVLFFNDSDKGIEVGKKVFENGKRPILELSGNDHLVIWKDANLEAAANSLLDCYIGSTQICMVPKKALIHEDIYDKFMNVFIKKVRSLKIGLPSDPETILSPVLKIKEFFEFLEDAIQNGGYVLTGGRRVNHLGDIDEYGPYIQPTVVEVPLERVSIMKCITQENFFPLLPVVKVSGGGLTTREKDRAIFAQMMELLDKNLYGLRTSIWVKDPYYLRQFIENVHHSGLLRINCKHIGFSEGVSTHGGVGRTGGPFGEMNYVWQKTSSLQGITLARDEHDKPILPKFEVLEEEIKRSN